jgi:hypothetical protein
VNTPYNTGKMDPLLILADALGPDGPSGAIERMEAQGQRELVNSTVLPSRLNSGTEDDLIALGFKFGEKVEGDPLFRQAELPPGWKREGSDHSMWSYVVDELGRKRLNIFYKAAFYDRDAFISVNTVFGYVSECVSSKGRPILDDGWATREAVEEAAEQCIARSREYLDMYEKDADAHGRKRAAELRKEITAFQALIDSLAAQAQPGGAA